MAETFQSLNSIKVAVTDGQYDRL